ncbi:TetR/AcrR family transcriptional regulator [uncultured Croceitalea sp.]|uniref:TetR/AcrR family transcriptional regulator n=1 Tax=uncultured Croceitalea sp. TaxID=1798908 RepID=UPI00330689D1
MKGNKLNILEAGLELYNKHGVTNVSQRTISDYLKISPGNLTYHFKKKEDIYEALYFEFVVLIKKRVSDFLHKEISLISFAILIELWFKDMHHYRFIFIDLSTLIRTNDAIKNNYRRMIEIRKSLFLKIVSELISIKTIEKEEFQGQYELLYNRLSIVSDFYLGSTTSEKGEEYLSYCEHSELFFSAMYPILTKKGKKEYKKLFKQKE